MDPISATLNFAYIMLSVAGDEMAKIEDKARKYDNLAFTVQLSPEQCKQRAERLGYDYGIVINGKCYLEVRK